MPRMISILVTSFACQTLFSSDMAGYVDPFVGTSATGHTFPGACVPFGMVQASPDGGTESWHYCSGYRYEDKKIKGFSQTHLNGTGGCELGDVRILPMANVKWKTENGKWVEGSPFEKASEVASPGYYAVTLAEPEVRVEVTASEHAAIYRFTYRKGDGAQLLLDSQWGIVNGGMLAKYVREGCLMVVDKSHVTGWKKTHNWNPRETGYAVEFDHPCKSFEKLPPMDAREKGERYVFDFDLKDGETLMVKVGLSAGDGATANLAAEIPGWDFDGVKTAARTKWNAVLGVATIEGTEEQKKNWYTSLYHLCIQPNNIADAGAKPFYSTFSCWDTFRAAGPLYTILYPEKAAAFVDSMLGQGKRTGYLPIWTLWGYDNQCMIGTHSVPMIVDAWLKGCWPAPVVEDNDGTVECVYQQIKETLTAKHEGRRKENWDLYDRYGYYPFDLIKGESVSRTMECAYDDWCAGVMAEKLGHAEDAAFFFKRSAYWKNVFDPSLGLVRGKDTKGNWREPFDPYALGHGANRANDFTEGNAFQYSWHVMQDVPGLVAAMRFSIRGM